MAAYAALVSLTHIIHQIENHPSPPISIHKQQVESLTENVAFLQEFLECYNSPVAYGDEADPLESRIADAAHAAEDVIESRIVDRIHSRSTVLGQMMRFSYLFRVLCKCTHLGDDGDDFYEDVQNVIEEMKLIKKEAMEVNAVKAQQQRKVSSVDHGSSYSTVKESMTMVGFDQVLLEVLDKLTSGQLNRQIIPIMGMGGIGKTTLARNIFNNALTKEHFDIRAWATVSQGYNTRETLREVLSRASRGSSVASEEEAGEKLYKFLYGKRYLVVLDDIWSVEAWDKMRSFFPDNKNGSRILVTTRLSNIRSQLSEAYGVGMKFLDEDSSWCLFSKTVFGEESNVPLELEEIGKKIVANCRGLPLSIVTIGGLLAKSQCTREYWKHIEENLNSIVITNDDDFCLKVLKTSYVNLPNYLKPCFLYMGVFEEDSRIRVSTLKKLWASEGFLKPRSGKCLETVAEEYLNDLVHRNLILVDQLGSTGNMKYCKIHDLLRDLCLREAADSKCRRIIIPKNTSNEKIMDAFKSTMRARCIISDHEEVPISGNLKLLRILKAYGGGIDTSCPYIPKNVFRLVNSRYIAVKAKYGSEYPSSISLLWNLHTLVVHAWYDATAPREIWKMHQLRHIEFTLGKLHLPHPPRGHDVVVMANLQTLRGVKNFYLDEEMVGRIPNMKKLHIRYTETLTERVNCLSYLQCLSKLESFHCSTDNRSDEYLEKISFPHSLKKLNISASFNFKLEDMLQKIGSLPLLQKLVLAHGFFGTKKWETIEGQFLSLKVLKLSKCQDLQEWTMSESSHFPVLRELRLDGLDELEEIPSEIGDIATLKSIDVYRCGEAVVMSAKRIIEEQEGLHGEELDLHVHVTFLSSFDAYAWQRWTNPNFHVGF